MKRQIRIHYLQHVPFEGLGCITNWAKKENHLLSCTRLYQNEPLPAVSELDWLIIMGGPMGIYDEQEFSWLTEEKLFLKEAIATGKTVLGICLGGQLLANALGAKVKPGKDKEIGWFPIQQVKTCEESVFSGIMPEQTTVFHWHGDQFEIPQECIHLAKSEACPSQAFQYRHKVIGLQFHFEATPESIGAMIKNGKKELAEKGKYIQKKEDILSGLINCEQGNRIMYSLLDRLSQIK